MSAGLRDTGPSVEWRSPASGRRGGPAGLSATATILTAALVLGAANVHLFLTPEHFREGLQFGLFFLAAGVFQLWLVFALLLMPGPRVYRVGLWGSGAIAVTWMITRLIPAPGAPEPEPVEIWGVLATALEIAAIVALAASLPSVAPRPPHARGARSRPPSGLGSPPSCSSPPAS